MVIGKVSCKQSGDAEYKGIILSESSAKHKMYQSIDPLLRQTGLLETGGHERGRGQSAVQWIPILQAPEDLSN